MARKRMIDPEFWSDEEIGVWSHSARLFYIGLWNFADDEGRFKAHNQLLKSQVFPYDKDVDIEALKKELSHKIQWYEVGGLQYGFIRNFLKHQRIDKPYPSKLPIPPPLPEHSPNIPGMVPPKIKENKISKDNKKAEPSPELKAALDKIYKDKLNIYSLLSRIKKESKSRVGIPEAVLVRVCESYWKQKPDIQNAWAWFKRVVVAEWEAWNAQEQIRQGKEWKESKSILSIAQIMRGIK